MKRLLLCSTAAAFLATAPAYAQDDKVSIVVNAVQIFGTIDPAKINDYTEYMAAVNLYDGLTTVNSDGQIIPQLAESWDVSDDNLTYTFHLKEGATFQDGSPVEAKDVVWSMQRLLALNEGPSYLFADLVDPANVTAPDEKTVVITLSKVYAPFISVTPLILPVNSDLVMEQNDGEWGEDYLAENPAGAGPYSLESWNRGAEMKLARYDGYHAGWDKGKPIDEVRFVVTRDEATVKALADSGELGISSQYQANETYDSIAKVEGYEIVPADTATGFYLKLNNQKPPTDDIHIRRAIAYALDTMTIRESIFPGGEMNGPLASVFKDAYLDSLPAQEYNLEKAQEEIAQSKYAGETPIKLEHAYVAKTAFEEEIGLLIQATLDSIGFETSLQPEPWNRITELASAVDTTPNTTQVFFGPTYPSPDSVFYVQYHTGAKGTWSSMDWPAVDGLDALIDRSRTETDLDTRNATYKEIQQLIMDNQVTIPMLTQEKRYAFSSCIKGYEWVPMQSWDMDISKLTWNCE